jgi:hypothetical protein
MVIKLFTFCIFALSLWAYFIPIEEAKDRVINQDIPLVIFENPYMYTIDENCINRTVQASYAIKYKNRDEMLNADIFLKNIDKNKNFNNENLKADLIVKRENDYTLTNNVKYLRDDFVKLNTNELFYNDLTKIATNSKPFDGIYNNNFVKGETLYLDINKGFVAAQNTHFEIEIDNKQKGKK